MSRKKRQNIVNVDDEKPPQKKAKLTVTLTQHQQNDRNTSSKNINNDVDVDITTIATATKDSNSNDNCNNSTINVNKSIKISNSKTMTSFEFFTPKLWNTLSSPTIYKETKVEKINHYPNDCCDKPSLCQSWEIDSKPQINHSFIHLHNVDDAEHNKVYDAIVASLDPGKKVLILNLNQTLVAKIHKRNLRECGIGVYSDCAPAKLKQLLAIDCEKESAKLKEKNNVKIGDKSNNDNCNDSKNGENKITEKDVRQAKKIQSYGLDFIDSQYTGYIFRPHLKEFLLYVTKEFNVGIAGGSKYYADIVEYWNQEWLFKDSDTNSNGENKIRFLVNRWHKDGRLHLSKVIHDRLRKLSASYACSCKSTDKFEGKGKNTKANENSGIHSCIRRKYDAHSHACTSFLVIQDAHGIELDGKRRESVNVMTTIMDNHGKVEHILPPDLYLFECTIENINQENEYLNMLKNNILSHWKNNDYDKINQTNLNELSEYPLRQYILIENKKLIQMIDWKQNDDDNISNSSSNDISNKSAGVITAAIASKIDLLKRIYCVSQNIDDGIVISDININTNIPKGMPAPTLRNWHDDRLSGIGDEFSRAALTFGDFFQKKIVNKLHKMKQHVLFVQVEHYLWYDSVCIKNDEIENGFYGLENIQYEYHFMDDITLRDKNLTILYKIKNFSFLETLKFCVIKTF